MLFVEDVLEVVSDTVVVHEAAASRIQRLTKVPPSAYWSSLIICSRVLLYFKIPQNSKMSIVTSLLKKLNSMGILHFFQ